MTTASCRASGRLIEQMDDKETTSSRLKILDAIEYEIPSASKLERPTFRCGEQTMPVHVKLYDSKDGQDRCEQDATRCQDFPDDRVSQRVDPLPPLSGAKDTGLQGPARATSSTAPRHNQDSTACNKTYKDHEDVMLGASNRNKLPISYFYTTAGRIRDVTAMIHARAAHQLACARLHHQLCELQGAHLA